MKTAVSIPDGVFDAADRLAARLGVSRSELYTCALRSLLERESDDAVTARLDDVYAQDPGGLADDLKQAQRGAVAERR
jgi:hypothetical protein